MAKNPTHIDKHVGARLRMRRLMLGMSQERLAEQLNLTFQQVQKYEKGTNRVGAGRLQDISRILEVAVSFFFEDMPQGQVAEVPVGGFAEDHSSTLLNFLATQEGLMLTRNFLRIKDGKVRRKVIDMVVTFADMSEGRATDDEGEDEDEVAGAGAGAADLDRPLIDQSEIP